MHTVADKQATEKSWYMQFWPWFLIALPMTAVVASIATVIIANKTSDALVSDNYYKAGLAINQVLDHKRLAKKFQINASMHYANTLLTISVAANDLAAINADALVLRFIHPTLRERDHQITLKRAGVQAGKVRFIGQLLPDKRNVTNTDWYLQLEPVAPDNKQAWRLDGKLAITHHAQINNYKLVAD